KLRVPSDIANQESELRWGTPQDGEQMQSSFPVEQPQPNQEFYDLAVLLLLKSYTRDSYRATGNGDPVWDPSRPEQDWWDDSYQGKSGPITFNAIRYASDGAATIVQITQDAKAMSAP